MKKNTPANLASGFCTFQSRVFFTFVSPVLLCLTLSACGTDQPSVAETLPNTMVKKDVLVTDLTADAPTSPAAAPAATPAQPAPTTAAPAAPARVHSTPRAASASAPRAASAPPTRTSEDSFRLSNTGMLLGLTEQNAYLEIQNRWVGSTIPACNFFLITALCEAGYCETEKPFYLAAEFDLYFIQQGWKQVSLSGLKRLFIEHAKFDAVFQKPGPAKGRSGHVMVAAGYDSATDQIIIAQGNLGVATNEIEKVGDDFLLNWDGGFTVFVKQ
ncbi:MAG: hypothetical protein H7222_08420 [Methylotenera sp.]|nr:hypothetical protein [Oligoflexia bacterium]